MSTETFTQVRPLAALFEEPRDLRPVVPHGSTQIGNDDTGTWSKSTEDNDT
jgi:hypothetical protein